MPIFGLLIMGWGCNTVRIPVHQNRHGIKQNHASFTSLILTTGQPDLPGFALLAHGRSALEQEKLETGSFGLWDRWESPPLGI